MKNHEFNAYIGLGSNLDHPKQQLAKAIYSLEQCRECKITGCSRLYCSKPWGGVEQPDFYNMVLSIETRLTPLALLARLQSMEYKQKRKRDIHWGPRTIDLDILLYGNQIIQSQRLTVPHAQMHLRNFVLFPLADINDSLVLPSGKSVSMLCKEVGDDGLMVVDDPLFKKIRKAVNDVKKCSVNALIDFNLS